MTNEQLLRRAVLSCLLGEDTFYEGGVSITERIKGYIKNVEPTLVASLAVEAREKYKLRSVPLLLARELARNTKGKLVSETIARVIQRPDELAKFLRLYWTETTKKKRLNEWYTAREEEDETCTRKPLSAQVKKGLAQAFGKFNEYSLAKWNQDGDVKLRDVLFLSHPKPKDQDQADLWKRLANNQLQTPDTWEVNLSAPGTDKKLVWERLLSENKLGAIALLKNLRNIQGAQVPNEYIIQTLARMNVERVLPFRFITAEKYSKGLGRHLEEAMYRCIRSFNKLDGKTVLLVDISGSMNAPLSNKADYNRIDAATSLAILLQELCEETEIYSFSDNTMRIKPSRGFALAEAIDKSQSHGSTNLHGAIKSVFHNGDKNARYIIITDEQATDDGRIKTISPKSYIINVAPYQKSIVYGDWKRMDGFSENVMEWIYEYEKEEASGWETKMDNLFMSIIGGIENTLSPIRL
jgi:60 kDa SS-A/Ro ribonucleoprotein